MKSIDKGWVIIDPELNKIYDFTFSLTRKQSIKHWVSLWDKPKNWKSHYQKGYRCVKATQTTELAQ